MKPEIHPKYHVKAKFACACGNAFEVGSTSPEIHVEICSQCHPFYTGTQKLVDTSRRVDKFQIRTQKAAGAAAVRKGKKAKAETRKAKKVAKTEKAEA